MASSRSDSEFAPTWPSRLLPVPTMAYLSLSAVMLVPPSVPGLRRIFRRSKPRKDLVAKHRHFVHVIDKDQRHPVQSGFGQPQELLRDLVIAADHREGRAAADDTLHHLAHQFW